MILCLHEINKQIANKVINDDSFELWIACKDVSKYKASPAAFYSRKHIQPEHEFLRISFVDMESGELLFINCLERMHNAMVRFSLYPNFMLTALNKKQEYASV